MDWYPWGTEAFQKAVSQDKPVFLSIGYSSCHWCHELQAECFNDSEIAQIMNKNFVNILVDREERPDIDQIYLNAYRTIEGAGGWPLNVILNPDQKPFMLIPYNRPDKSEFLESIRKVTDIWKNSRQVATDTGEEIQQVLLQTNKPGPHTPDVPILHEAYRELAERFDPVYGGFQPAPKFPSPHELLFLLRYWKRTGNRKAIEMVEKTLQGLRRGGIYDQLGFGFHRYTEDSFWLLPHFEKMIYDQALLVIAYAEAYQATGQQEYKNTAEEILLYVQREMTDPSGAFYSSEDADTDGIEGSFYSWDVSEIRKLLKEDADLILKFYGIQTAGSILSQKVSISSIAKELGLKEDDVKNRIEKGRAILLDHRNRRSHPQKDDKILTDWNGLMIAAYAKSAQAFGEPRYAEAAKRAADFLTKTLRRNDGGLLHRYRKGSTGISAYLDDYAFFIWGLIEIYEATFEISYLQTAIEINQYLLDHFWDTKGGFYLTSDESESLLYRSKEIYDGAIPSGNSVAVWNLLRLAKFTGNQDLHKRAEMISRFFYQNLMEAPSAHCQLLVGIDFQLGPVSEVVIAGNSDSTDTREMLRAVQSRLLPGTVIILRAGKKHNTALDRIAPFTMYHAPIDGKATAYVCRQYVCRTPTTNVLQMMRLLESP